PGLRWPVHPRSRDCSRASSAMTTLGRRCRFRLSERSLRSTCPREAALARAGMASRAPWAFRRSAITLVVRHRGLVDRTGIHARVGMGGGSAAGGDRGLGRWLLQLAQLFNADGSDAVL